MCFMNNMHNSRLPLRHQTMSSSECRVRSRVVRGSSSYMNLTHSTQCSSWAKTAPGRFSFAHWHFSICSHLRRLEWFGRLFGNPALRFSWDRRPRCTWHLQQCSIWSKAAHGTNMAFCVVVFLQAILQNEDFCWLDARQKWERGSVSKVQTVSASGGPGVVTALVPMLGLTGWKKLALLAKPHPQLAWNGACMFSTSPDWDCMKVIEYEQKKTLSSSRRGTVTSWLRNSLELSTTSFDYRSIMSLTRLNLSIRPWGEGEGQR